MRYKIIPKLFGHTVLASIFALLENLKRKWWQFFAISFFPFRLLFLSFSPDCMIEVVLSISLSHQRGRLIVVVLNKAKILYRTSKKLHFFLSLHKAAAHQVLQTSDDDKFKNSTLHSGLKTAPKIGTFYSVWKSQKIAFNKASYVYILSGLKLTVKQCYQIGHF